MSYGRFYAARMAFSGCPNMSEVEKLWARTVSSFLNLANSMADFIEQTAKLEQATHVKIRDYTRLISTEEFVDFLQKQLGPEGLSKLAILLLRMSSIRGDIFDAPPEERLKTANDLRKVLLDLEEMRMIFEKVHKQIE